MCLMCLMIVFDVFDVSDDIVFGVFDNMVDVFA